MLADIEDYCAKFELAHFLMSSDDDVLTVQSAFQHVIQQSLEKGLQKKRWVTAEHLLSLEMSAARSKICSKNDASMNFVIRLS